SPRRGPWRFSPKRRVPRSLRRCARPCASACRCTCPCLLGASRDSSTPVRRHRSAREAQIVPRGGDQSTRRKGLPASFSASAIFALCSKGTTVSSRPWISRIGESSCAAKRCRAIVIFVSDERGPERGFHRPVALPTCPLIMARPKPSTFDKVKTVAENRRARFEYFIEETFEAGIALSGTEVKSLRFGAGSIAESYAEVRDGEAWLVNANIPEFSHGNRFNHEPRRPRKLLLHKREVEKLLGAVERKGMTMIPLSIYFNSRGRAKVELALAKGKQTHDKRQAIKDRDWQRDKARLMRERG